MLSLRRLATDSEHQHNVLRLLEQKAAAGEVEPWIAVLLAEHARISGDAPADTPPKDEHLDALLLDPALVELMREQADGPWAVYVEQARATAWQHRVGDALLQLAGGDPVNPVPKRGAAVSDPLSPQHLWDIAISYAGKDQAFVTAVVERLEHAGLRVFYAALPEAQSYLWGKELGLVLQTIYRERAAYCLVFVSTYYVQSAYTKLEFRTALSRALENDEYVKPIRLDDAELPGLSPTVSFLDARPGRLHADPARLAPLIVDALRNRGQFVPGRRLRERPQAPGLSVREYFDSALPATLRWRPEQAISVGGSVLFDVTGDDPGVWLLRLAPPVAEVLHIEPNHDLRTLVLARHLRIRITSAQMRAMLAGGFDARRALIEGGVDLDGDLRLLKPAGALFAGQSARSDELSVPVEPHQDLERMLDEALGDTFPASDPVSMTQPARRR